MPPMLEKKKLHPRKKTMMKKLLKVAITPNGKARVQRLIALSQHSTSCSQEAKDRSSAHRGCSQSRR